MMKVWHVGKPVIFKEINPNILVITFANTRVKDRVLEGRPGLFDNNLLVLNQFDGVTQSSKLTFTIELFGVQLHIYQFSV